MCSWRGICARLERVQREIEADGGSAQATQLDLLSEQSIAKFAESIDRCDILVNNAAVGGTGRPLHEMPPAEWDQMMATNLRAPYLMIRALAPKMIAAKSGHIINISSLAGHSPLPNGAAYSASKWGLNGLTYSVAEELRPHGIRVSVIAPGSTNTRFEGGYRQERPQQKDPARRCSPRRRHAGNAGSAIVCQRSAAQAHAKAVSLKATPRAMPRQDSLTPRAVQADSLPAAHTFPAQPRPQQTSAHPMRVRRRATSASAP